MPRLNKTEKYAILWLNNQGMQTDDIANELGIDNKQISKVISSTKKNEANNNSIKTTSAPLGKTQNLMIMESAGKRKNVAIMTKEASSSHDDLKKSVSANNHKLDKNIYRPQDNKNK